MNRDDAIDFARAHALHHGRAGDHAYLPSTLEQAAEFLPHAWVVDALCEAVETRIVDDESVLKMALDLGYTPSDDFGDEELLSFARELRTVLTPWSMSEEPTGEHATCNTCGYRLCHEDCGAEDYEVQAPDDNAARIANALDALNAADCKTNQTALFDIIKEACGRLMGLRPNVMSTTPR